MSDDRLYSRQHPNQPKHQSSRHSSSNHRWKLWRRSQSRREPMWQGREGEKASRLARLDDRWKQRPLSCRRRVHGSLKPNLAPIFISPALHTHHQEHHQSSPRRGQQLSSRSQQSGHRPSGRFRRPSGRWGSPAGWSCSN